MSKIERADTDIQWEVRETLTGVGLPLSVTVNRGVVTLEGTVLSEEEREAAIDLVRYVGGVADIVDAMEIMEIEGEPPTVLLGYLTRPEEWDTAVDEQGDDWTVDERRAIQEDDSYTPPTDPPVDISDDRAGIEVASGFQTSSMDDDEEMYRDTEFDQTRGARDGEIIDNIIRELNEDASTTHLDIHVASINGTVYLTGYVDDPYDTDLVAAVAERVPGVRYVVDRLIIGEEPQSVPRIRRYRTRRRRGRQLAMPSPAWRTTVARNERWLEAELAKLEAQVEERREELAGFGRDQADEGTVTNHQGDIASDVTTAGTLNTEIVNMEDEIDTIHELQRKLEDGTYGICIDCGRYIDPARLRAFPLALRCIQDQQRYDDRQAASIPAGRQIG